MVVHLVVVGAPVLGSGEEVDGIGGNSAVGKGGVCRM